MKTSRLLRWSGTVLTPRTRPGSIRPRKIACKRWQSSAAAPPSSGSNNRPINVTLTEQELLQLPSPPTEAARTSAKLSALHARLSLPTKLPLDALARTLVDASADPSPQFNNKPLAVLGNDLLGYYTSEYIICQYPRLPLAVVFAAMYAYVGPKALAAITREWGVEIAAEPGGEVDPGLLQLKHVPPGTPPDQPSSPIISTTPQPGGPPRKHPISSRTIYDNEFGERREKQSTKEEEAVVPQGTTVEKASSSFIRAVMGAVYLHGGRIAAKQFYREHFMSRKLAMASLFSFRQPTRDLSRLCAREGFRSPVARILSETGRKSRHPVFVVGVYSGNEKLGEGAGSSLDEARTRAAVSALKGWYLYSPIDFHLPSDTEEPDSEPWSPVLVDYGDIVT